MKKRYLYKIVSILLVLSMTILMASTALAAENIDGHEEQLTSDQIVALADPYVFITEDGLLSINLPDSVKNKLGDETFALVQSLIDRSNQNILNGDVILLSNKEMIKAGPMPRLGDFRITAQWWGYQIWLTSYQCSCICNGIDIYNDILLFVPDVTATILSACLSLCEAGIWQCNQGFGIYCEYSLFTGAPTGAAAIAYTMTSMRSQ